MFNHSLLFFLAIFYFILVFIFFFQAEDGIRDYKVTGVQTCALPILTGSSMFGGSERRMRATFACTSCWAAATSTFRWNCRRTIDCPSMDVDVTSFTQIGRASCRERV